MPSRFMDKWNAWRYLAVTLTKTDSAVGGTGLTGKPGSMPHLFAEPGYSIEDILASVKPEDGEFLKCVPGEFLKEEQLRAKRMVASG